MSRISQVSANNDIRNIQMPMWKWTCNSETTDTQLRPGTCDQTRIKTTLTDTTHPSTLALKRTIKSVALRTKRRNLHTNIGVTIAGPRAKAKTKARAKEKNGKKGQQRQNQRQCQ
eukprot:5829226-Amphidinium_carterae.1